MQSYKKIYVLLALLVYLFTGVASTKPHDDDEHFTNLKVLPKKTSDEEMDRIMHGFSKQLGVGCLYCHVPKKGVFPPDMDFASDEKPEKRAAREMLRMTIKINEKYFGVKDKLQAIRKPVVRCRTCHHGHPLPPPNQ